MKASREVTDDLASLEKHLMNAPLEALYHDEGSEWAMLRVCWYQLLFPPGPFYDKEVIMRGFLYLINREERQKQAKVCNEYGPDFLQRSVNIHVHTTPIEQTFNWKHNTKSDTGISYTKSHKPILVTGNKLERPQYVKRNAKFSYRVDHYEFDAESCTNPRIEDCRHNFIHKSKHLRVHDGHRLTVKAVLQQKYRKQSEKGEARKVNDQPKVRKWHQTMLQHFGSYY